MKYLLFALICFNSVQSLKGQDFAVEHGKIYDYDYSILYAVPFEEDIVALLTEGSENFFDGDEKIYVSRFEKDYTIEKSIEKKHFAKNLLPITRADEFNIHAFKNISGKIYLYYTKYYNKTKSLKHCVLEVNVETPSLSTEKVLGEVVYDNKFPNVRWLINQDFSVVSFVVIPVVSDKDASTLSAKAFTTLDHIEIWSQSFLTMKMGEQIIFYDSVLGIDGTMVLGYKMFKKHYGENSYKNNKGIRLPSYTLNLILLNKDLNKSVKLDRGIDYSHFFKLGLLGNDVIACGTYSTVKNSNVGGIYKIVFNLDSQLVTLNHTEPFSQEILSSLKNEKVAKTKTNKQGIKFNTGNSDLIVKDNGQIFYIIKPIRRKVVMDEDGLNRGYYFAKSIIVVDVTDEINFSLIPRSTQSAEAIRIYKSQNKIYVFYKDHIKNIGKEKKLKPLRKWKHGVMAVATIDENNNISRKVVVDFSSDKYIFEPSNTIEIEENKFLLDGKSLRRKFLVEISENKNLILLFN